MEQMDVVVIGAGVVGLAIARKLALAGREVMVLERERMIGSITSSRNSEVIHAGLYYPASSLKADLCVAGKNMLYAFCAERGVPHRRCGKLIVATAPEQLTALDAIVARGAAAGVDDLVRLDPGEIASIEPQLATAGGLLSSSTGIVDAHAYMLALQGEAEAHGAMVVLNTAVATLEPHAGGIRVRLDDSEGSLFDARLVIDAAGLDARALAATVPGYDPAHLPPMRYAKGSYFSLEGKVPFRHLVYPVPEPGGLGVHLTLDLAGRARFGPDVEWVDEIDYAVEAARGERFYAAIRRYWPGLPDDALVPSYSGIRPKISGPGEPAADFLIEDQRNHGVPGLITLLGIESPGLTASLAIAAKVAAMAKETAR